MKSRQSKTYNIVLTGVGGTGVLTAARILGSAAVKQGFRVRVGEVHGIAQRGGMIDVQVRIGEDVFAPTFMEGQANLLIGFELAEALRHANKLSREGVAIINDYRITPTMVTLGHGSYPAREKVIAAIKRFTKNMMIINAVNLAKEAGSAVTVGSVLLGAAVSVNGFPLKMETLKKTVEDLLSKRLLRENLKALDLGYNFARS